MDMVVALVAVMLVPVLVGGFLARRTGWLRSVIALIAGAPLPLVMLGVVLTDYANAIAMPPERCGFSCRLDRALAPQMIAVAVGGMVIAVAIAFLTATIVRRRRR